MWTFLTSLPSCKIFHLFGPAEKADNSKNKVDVFYINYMKG